MQNPFGTNFDLATLSAAINVLPNQYGRINGSGIFRFKPGNNPTVMLEEKNGVLTLVPTKAWGAPGTQNRSGKRKTRAFVVPHTPLDDIVKASDVMGVRAFGTENQLETISGLINDKLQEMKNKLDQTAEYRMMSALKGVVTDSDGSTMYDLYAEFGQTQVVVDFVLGTGTTDVRAKCMSVVRAIEDNLLGEVSSGVRALVSPEFFDKLVSHANVEKAYANYQEAAQRLGGDMRKGFTFGSITFEEYRAQTVNSAGAATRYIAAGEGHVYPEGTMDTFGLHAAPADFIETVNTQALRYYARQQGRDFNRGVDLHTQTNILPMCYRPKVLIKIHTSN